MSEEAAAAPTTEAPGWEPAGPPPAYRALAVAANAEYARRIRQATLVPVVAALAADFALGASMVPTEWLRDLLFRYLVFLAVFGVVLALALLRVSGGAFGRAISVAEAGRQATLRAREEVTGDANLPKSPVEAVAWLASHEAQDGIHPQRLSVQLQAGNMAGARESLSHYPRGTPYERYWYEADAWTLDMLDGQVRDLGAVEAEVRATEDPYQRAHAESGLALLRSYVEVLAGRDWIAPLADASTRVGPFADDSWRAPMLIRTWTQHMAVAALLIGGAMAVARLTGVWPLPS